MTNIKHLAIIMDGNARWAGQNNLPKSEGHRAGANKIHELLPEFINFGIPYITLYTFSSENWQRSSTEVDFLIKLLGIYLKTELNNLHKNGVKIKVIGRLNLLNSSLQKQINNAIELTKNNNKITLCIAFSYGSRQEIVDACTKIIASGKKEVTESDLQDALYDPEMPDVDLLIRPGGVYRISNFLLWQTAYAELYFSPKYWPDFNKDDIQGAINDYSKRKRTFGKR
ncbi:MAG: polyprenyl diphosphate synthase [Rickettsia endosymbiont of Ixodes persulcatus]|nr:polyprenyl diphosphate synthase [Rickettsia endosymbiont of Ixodes persulcatus]MCZ6901537.1 polyprenyl diphosphate synthase [Rickettsia endosymbiont of Ixodes persulcatus]MCZ6903109.1 polyprenyl diphosphate synthase [Rickettsia endosymbiont of Ixodes persulcatus]MCZ6909128.1 polyprenyl diphosphate synthase [Rickettsia endosymbiont of Ixodes persulcatus]MCZ6910635.1 polyprenyl diphosphate synthase [Rickettsia endosymbiont of Ixodes persulcatus]